MLVLPSFTDVSVSRNSAYVPVSSGSIGRVDSVPSNFSVSTPPKRMFPVDASRSLSHSEYAFDAMSPLEASDAGRLEYVVDDTSLLVYPIPKIPSTDEDV